MKSSRVPWEQKLKPEQQPKLVDDPAGRGQMLVPTPLLVAEELRKVPRGRLITPHQLRDRLARRCAADVTCPLTTGIFINIVAGAAEEHLAAGRRPIAPYWRVVDPKGFLSEKTPPGPQRQAALLRAEGHRVERVAKSRKWRVPDFERRLVAAKARP